MITIGGLDNINTTDYCDWEYMSVAIYDLTEGDVSGWGSVFSANKPPYQVTAKIVQEVGGTPDGKATKLLPDGGWSSAATAKLFTGTNNATAPATILNATSPEPSSAPGPRMAKHVNKGAVAGGTVGGIVMLAILAGIIYYAMQLRSRKKRAKQEEENRAQAAFSKPELDSNGVNTMGSGPGVGTEEKELEDPDLHKVLSEASENPRSELAATTPAAVAATSSESHELE